MARALVQSKIDKAIREADGEQPTDDGLQPGNMRLYSFYKPSLQAARYGIEVKQGITAIRGDDLSATILSIFNSHSAKDKDGNDQGPVVQQEFNVIAPQFTLDPKLINVFYPPSGHQDEGRILPHIVFNDPHVPWFREAGLSHWMTGPVDTGKAGSELEPDENNGRNFVPWLALMVFRPDDLAVEDGTAQTLKLKDFTTYDSLKLPANGAYAMTVGDYLSKLKSRVYYEAGYLEHSADNSTKPQTTAEFTTLQGSSEVTSVIFPKKAQVQSVFGSKLDTSPLQAQKLLAHVRHINTIGFPDAGVLEEGYFSVIVSSMTGDQIETAQSTHIVHLVSIEHMDSTLSDANSSFFASDNSERIGLVSLFNWTYTCIPDAVSFEDAMADLANAAQPLRPPKETLEALRTSIDAGSDPFQAKADMALLDRLNAGYTISRWRTTTGEESVAFNRSALVPMQVDAPPAAALDDMPARLWPALSMTGKDYQIFDASVGIMDVTYSAAWSLGKLMAISDSVFNAALMRYRGTVWSTSASVARMTANGVPPKAEVLSGTTSAVAKAQNITGSQFVGAVSRINNNVSTAVALPLDHPDVQPIFRHAVDNTTSKLALAGEKIFNGYDNAPANNSDWAVICNWLTDVLYLQNIPAHALFPEPSHLRSQNALPQPPDRSNLHPEALRFFHIDHRWVDAFIDGALSCANHLEPQYDYTRLRIKAVFNQYLDTPVGKTNIKPPVPRYGFILRSSVVKATPDLRLTVRCWKPSTTEWIEDQDRDPLVKHVKLDEFTILSLVDCLPEEICVIKFAQPPHQQRFALHSEVEQDALSGKVKVKPHVKFKRLYTSKNWLPPRQDPHDKKDVDPSDALQWKELSESQQVPEPEQADWYSADSRCIQPIKISQAAIKKLLAWAADPSYPSDDRPYNDPIPNSCVLGLELNDPSYQLEIQGVAPADLTAFPAWTRQLWVGSGAESRPQDVDTFRNDQTTSISKPSTASTPAAAAAPKLVLPPPSLSLQLTSPPRTVLNIVKPMPTIPTLAKTSLVDPFVNSLAPQFELLVHPDYRPPPPRPTHDRGGHMNNDVFSPLDKLPTGTDYLYDLIFAVRRRGNLQTKLNLQSITIEIPVSDNGNKPDSKGRIREPLLEAGNYAGVGVRMCSNPRFVPALFNGAASSIGSSLWDGKAVLGITLIPRSGQSTGTMPLLADGKSMEASVRLSEARIMPIVDHSTTALIAQGVDPVTNRTFNKALPRGRCMIKMTEHYGDNRTNEWSWCCALKIDGGDTSPWGDKM